MWKLRGPPWGIGKVSELYSLNNEVFDWWSNLTSTVLDRLFWSPCYTYELWAKNQPRNLTARPLKKWWLEDEFPFGIAYVKFPGVYIYNISPLNIQWLEHDSFPFASKGFCTLTLPTHLCNRAGPQEDVENAQKRLPTVPPSRSLTSGKGWKSGDLCGGCSTFVTFS